MDKLLKFLNSLPKQGRLDFAKACGTSEGYIRKAISAKQVFSAALCVAIERESHGAVTRQDLRPIDWAANWPELAERLAAAA